MIQGDVYDGMIMNLLVSSTKEQEIWDDIQIEVMGKPVWTKVPRMFSVSIRTGINGTEYYVTCVQGRYIFARFMWISYLGEDDGISHFLNIQLS